MKLPVTPHINYKIPVIALIVLLLCFGFYAFIKIKSSLYPDITFPKIKIILYAGQEPVEKMMATVTVPIENAIKKTEGLDYVSSVTSRGTSEISVFLKWGTDIDIAKQQIESFVNQANASMNNTLGILVEKMNTSMLPVSAYSLSGKKSLVELRNIAEYQIKPFLSEVDGIANVEVLGGKTKEYQIIVKPERLSQLNISLAQIQTVIAQENIFQSNGYIRDHNRLYLTITNNELENTEELKNLVIENSASRLVLLSDLAELQLNEVRDYIKVHTGGEEKPIISIIKQPNANLLEVNHDVQKRVKELASILPKDVRLLPFYQQANFVMENIQQIQIVLWLGLLFSLLLVIVGLRSFSSSIAIIFSIPFAMTLTMIILYILGYSFNLMTLGGIAAAVGLMIDDAVIVVEQIQKNRSEYPHKKLALLIAKSNRFLFPAMVASSLGTIVIFVPYIFMSGVAGEYFKVLAFTMMIALGSSFIVSWLITPMLLLFFSPTKSTSIEIHLPKTNWIKYVLQKPFIGFFIALCCLLCLIFLPSKLQTGFLPELVEGSLIMNFESPPGTDLEETNRLLSKVDTILKQQPEVESFSRRLGTTMGITITEPNKGDCIIQLKKGNNKSAEDIANIIRRKIESSIPVLRVDIGQVLNRLLGELMGNSQPIEIKVFGDDRQTIENLSFQIAQEIRTISGIVDAFDGLVRTGPKVVLRPNVALLAQLGMNPADFQFQMQTQTEGNIISTIIDKDQLLNVRIIYPNASDLKIHALENTNILLPNGALKPLSSVASIRLESGEARIQRENHKMVGVISAGLTKRDLGSTLLEVKEKINRSIHLPAGYHIEYAGAYSQQQQSFRELLLIFLSGLCLVFVVILFLFRKLRISLLVLTLSALGVSGSILALYLTGTPINVGSYTGIIIVAGIIGENAIFTYWHYQEARRTMSAQEAMIYSMGNRLRPKLLTVLAVILAFVPLAANIGTVSQVHRPLAIAAIGGLLVALPILLIVLPTFEIYFSRHDEK